MSYSKLIRVYEIGHKHFSSKMAYNFEGKKFLVTGAGRNIGRTVATNLANSGPKVFALDCLKENLVEFVQEIPDIVPVHHDLRNW